MHDCPSCRVPLHGYEEVCPSCGARQAHRKQQRSHSNFRPEQPGINFMPFVLVFLACGIVIILAMSGSWIGKLAKEGPPKEDPMEKMTYTEARNIIETELTNGLSAAGASAKLTWADTDGATQDKAIDKPLNLTVDTSLEDPNARRPIIEKVKDYMEKGKVPTLTMNDAKSHAHWTYNMVAPISQQSTEE